MTEIDGPVYEGEVDMAHFDIDVTPDGHLILILQMGENKISMHSATACALEVAQRIESFDVEGRVHIRIPTMGWSVQ